MGVATMKYRYALSIGMLLLLLSHTPILMNSIEKMTHPRMDITSDTDRNCHDKKRSQELIFNIDINTSVLYSGHTAAITIIVTNEGGAAKNISINLSASMGLAQMSIKVL